MGAHGLTMPRSVLGLGSTAGRSDPVMAVGSARQGAGVVTSAASVGEPVSLLPSPSSASKSLYATLKFELLQMLGSGAGLQAEEKLGLALSVPGAALSSPQPPSVQGVVPAGTQVSPSA